MSKANWTHARLKEVAPLQRGFDLTREEIKIGKYPVISSSGLWGYHNEAKVHGPGIVIGRYGTIGKVIFTEDDFWPHNTTLWVTDFCGNDPQFIDYLYRSLDFRKYSGKTGIPGLNRNDLHAIKIHVPPVHEQRAIASVLSLWDRAIELTIQLITAKQQRNRFLTQQLMAGLKRLPEYSCSTWRECTLGSVTQKHAFGPRFSSSLYAEDGNVGTIRTTDLNVDGIINYLNIPFARIPEGKFDSHFLNDGDLLISRSGTCGVPCLFEAQPKPVVAGAFLIRFELTDEVVPHFLFTLLKTSLLQRQIARLACGGVQKNLTGPSLLKLKFSLPSLKEQCAISDLVKVQNSELDVLTRKLDLLKQQKKGLMQQLLTGKIRVKVPKGEA